jgi:hypothetical protein
MGHIYVLLGPAKEVSHDHEYHADFGFSLSDLDSHDSPIQFITDKSQAPAGAAVIQWSETIRAFITQFN